jgi:NAD(P)-dependent dehydrogenase (short-subunit alcohol dehydrogenase family)
LVTGAGRNIGKAIAIEFAEQGANVIVNDLPDCQEANEVAAEAMGFGVEATAILADVSKREEGTRLVDVALSTLGRIDILVHTPGVRPVTPFTEISSDEWDRVFAVNLNSAFYCAQAVVPGMVTHGYGRIIFISGANVFVGGVAIAHVIASKAGLWGLAHSLALEFASCGITVNNISPGPINTSRTEEWWPGKPARSVSEHELLKGIPVGRLGEPHEVAGVCAFLASERAGYLTGQTIHLNGGQYIT